MISVFIKNIITWLIRHNAIQPDDRELYEYAVYSFIITVSPLFLVILISGIVGKICEGIVIILPFMVLRKFSGGFHAKKAGTCFVGSCALLFLCISAVDYITCNLVFKIITLGAAICLCIWSPIDSENRRLSDAEKETYKKTTWVIVMFFIVVFILFLIAGIEKFAVCIAIGLILSAGLQLPCVISKLMYKLKVI